MAVTTTLEVPLLLANRSSPKGSSLRVGIGNLNPRHEDQVKLVDVYR